MALPACPGGGASNAHRELATSEQLDGSQAGESPDVDTRNAVEAFGAAVRKTAWEVSAEERSQQAEMKKKV